MHILPNYLIQEYIFGTFLPNFGIIIGGANEEEENAHLAQCML